MFAVREFVTFKKRGKFYEVKYADAYILWYLLRYKIHNNKVGFPESSLVKVLDVLNENQVDYGFSLNDIQLKNNMKNKYVEILEKDKKEWIKEKKEKDLLEKIKKAKQEDLEKIVAYIESVL